MKENHIYTDSELEYTEQTVDGLVHYILDNGKTPEQLGFNVIQETKLHLSKIIHGINFSISRIGVLSESHFVEIQTTIDGTSSNISEILACAQAQGIKSSKLDKINNSFIFTKLFEIGGKSFEYIFKMNILSLLEGCPKMCLEDFFNQYHNSQNAIFELFPEEDGKIYELNIENLHQLPWTGIVSRFHGNIILTESIHTYPDDQQEDGGKYAYSSSEIRLRR